MVTARGVGCYRSSIEYDGHLFVLRSSRRGNCVISVFFFQAEDGIRDLVRSRGLGDVYKRQAGGRPAGRRRRAEARGRRLHQGLRRQVQGRRLHLCLLYTSDAADERSSVDLGGRRIIKKKKQESRL